MSLMLCSRTRLGFFEMLHIEWTSGSAVSKGHFISYLKARKLVSKGCIYHLVRFNNSSAQISLLQSVPIVTEFP